MELSDIFSLIDKFDSSSANTMELALGDFSMKLDRSAPRGQGFAQGGAPVIASAVASVAVNPAEEEPGGSVIRAPLVGTFYTAPEPNAQPFAPVGAHIAKGQTVCILEAMKTLSEVPSPFDCVIEEVLLKNGDLAGFDQPMFRVREV